MRGADQQQSHIFSYLSPEERVRKDHPLRAIRAMVDEVLKQLSRRFDAMYAKVGRPSIPPEQLLRAQLLQMLYSIRSERLLVCLESRRLLAGASPVVVIAREPRSRLPVLPGDWRC
jgi:transposase